MSVISIMLLVSASCVAITYWIMYYMSAGGKEKFTRRDVGWFLFISSIPGVGLFLTGVAIYILIESLITKGNPNYWNEPAFKAKKDSHSEEDEV